MAQPWILICPASQGIGLEITRRLLATTKLPIVATARTRVDEIKMRMLDSLDVDRQRLQVLPLDVTDEATVSAAAAHCRDRFPDGYLHLAFCIPGILHPERSPVQIDYGAALETFKVNTLGPLLLMKHFVPFLPKRATSLAAPSDLVGLPARAVFAMMSARVGSISDNARGGWYSYRGSKAAVNQIVKSLDIFLQSAAGGKAVAVGLHPGTVRTEFSREFWASTPDGKLFEPTFAAERLVEVVRGLGAEDGGKCWDWEGKEIPP